MAPLSVSMVPCSPPELLAPDGTFGLPGDFSDDEPQPAINNATRHESSSRLGTEEE